MPLTVITAEQQSAGLAAMDPELKFLLEEKRISVEIISLSGHLGLTDVTTVAHI